MRATVLGAPQRADFAAIDFKVDASDVTIVDIVGQSLGTFKAIYAEAQRKFVVHKRVQPFLQFHS
jgi:hypothetical protein